MPSLPLEMDDFLGYGFRLQPRTWLVGTNAETAHAHAPTHASSPTASAPPVPGSPLAPCEGKRFLHGREGLCLSRRTQWTRWEGRRRADVARGLQYAHLR